MKNKAYNWLWKWHFIAGLVSFPVVLILSVTGIIYLFKDNYESPKQQVIRKVEIGDQRLTYQQQLDITQQQWDKPVHAMVIPHDMEQATEFTSGMFSNKSSFFVDPYTGQTTGEVVVKQTDMYKVRKLHGELLTGSFGTKIVELVGSWMFVLIISGLFMFLPRKRKELKNLICIRFTSSRKVFFRDLHVVGGFWFSIILLVILAGGMPWTDVFGDYFKWIQKETNTGYPITWQGRGLFSEEKVETISLDDVVNKASLKHLPGSVSITLPKSSKGVYSIRNTYYANLSQQVAIHLDQYDGNEIASLGWEDVGVLMRARMWAMAFHQGQFGFWNWLLVLFTAFGMLLLSAAGVVSYFLKKKTGSWSVPSSSTYQVGTLYYIVVVLLGVILPLFGASVILIITGEFISRKAFRKMDNEPIFR